jgi:hypothetical protein
MSKLKSVGVFNPDYLHLRPTAPPPQCEGANGLGRLVPAAHLSGLATLSPSCAKVQAD